MSVTRTGLVSSATTRWYLVFVLGALLLAVPLFVAPQTPHLVPTICGATLCLFALMLWLQAQWVAYTDAHLKDTAVNMMAHDLNAGFMTDAAGVVIHGNKAAIDRFGAVTGSSLAQVLNVMLANPKAVLAQLRKQAAVSGAGTDDIMTRRGHFRLRVQVLAPDCVLWWLDDLSVATQGGARPPQEQLVAMITVDAHDTITHLNLASRKLLATQPRNLAEVIDDLPVRSGSHHRLKLADGLVKMMVVEVAGRDENRDLYLLPGAVTHQSPAQLDVGWNGIEDLPVPLLKIARDGILLGANREARQLLHMGAINGRRLADFLDGPGRPINDWLSEAFVGRDAPVSQFLKGRGVSQDTFVQVTLNTAGMGDNRHFIVVLNDVTELKTLEAQFVQSQKMQAIGQLAGGIAHDFNNLLTAISGHCDLLLLRHDEGDQNYGDLIQIHQNANRAASLVGQLLAFSRKQNLHLEAIDLRDTLADLTHLLNRLVGEKVILTLDHDPALSQIKADKRQLEQVLMNLVVNARDAMQGAGAIRVVTENRTLTKAMVRDRAIVPAGDYVVVSVIDTGHGIAPEKLHKIFEPFYTTKRVGEGTGLGLSTAYGIVKQTGGYIFADSEVGKGTTFSLLFPRFTAPLAAPLRRAVVQPEKIGGKADGVVLLVEDEAPVRAFASRALRLRGYTVLEADCAEAALELLADAELRVDIFVTDVIMPGLDGPTWVRQALGRRPDTKVVFVSGYPEDAFDDGLPPVPNAIFLPKPFSLSELTQTVHGQLQATTLPN